MKKVLSTVAALGLVAGIATSAAALELKVKGEYILDSYVISNARGILSGNGLQLGDKKTDIGEPSGTNEWFEHKFQVDADLIVNDNITMQSRIRFIDWGIWGQDDTNISDGNNFSVRRMWLVYKSPIGVWEIGRRPAGSWEHEFVNSGSRADRIMWKSGKMLGDSFSMYAFYQKSKELDGYIADDDRDSSYWEAYGAFTGYGKTSLAVAYWYDDTNDTPGGSTSNMYRIKGYGDYQFTDMIGMEMEFDYIWGDKEYNTFLMPDTDVSGLAVMADLQMNFGAAQANLMGFYLSGDDGTDADQDAYSSSKGSGNDFEPLYILTGSKTGILNNDSGTAGDTFGAFARNAGVYALVAGADFQAMEKLSFHGAVGYAEAADERPGWDAEYGWEFDAGLGYKLLDNLTYNLHFGYLVTGDFFKTGTPGWSDVNDITLLYNNLSMQF